MKKIMYIAAALLVLAGCSNKEEVNGTQNAPANYGTITGKIELPQGEDAKAGARMITAPNGWKAMEEAFKMQWESTDKIYIYNQTECKELAVKSIDTQTGNATFEGELLSDMSDYNVAYGYNPTAGTTAFAVDYIANNYRPFAWGTGENYIFTIDNFGPVMGLKLQGNAKVGKIEVIASKSGVAQATYTMTLGTAIELNTETPTTVYFPLNQLGDADKLEAKFYQGNSAVKTQTFVTLPAKNVVTTYPAIEVVYDPYNGHAYVDLGLPSGTKWATCNVGATAPEGYGDYFAWGEVEPYYSSQDPLTWKEGKTSGYAWQSYCGIGSFTEWNPAPYDATTKNLKPEYDAAHVNWGGIWRMPTKAEIAELLDENKCKKEWTTLNNVNGYKFTSLIEGYTDKSIFLPASGYRSELSLFGSNGRYWSSSLYESNSYYAYHLFLVSDYVNCSNFSRNFGLSVRPVCQ